MNNLCGNPNCNGPGAKTDVCGLCYGKEPLLRTPVAGDPVYKYTKDGWVPEHLFNHEFEHSGKRWVLEVRKPEIGENYIPLYSNDSKATIDSVAQIIIRKCYKPSAYYEYGPTTKLDWPTMVYRELT